MWDWLQQSLASNAFFSGALFTSLIVGSLAYLRNVPLLIWNAAVDKFTTTVTMHSSDPLYTSFQCWMKEQRYDLLSRNYRVVSQYSEYSDQNKDGPRPLMAPNTGRYLTRIHGKFVLITCLKANKDEGSGGYNDRPREYLTLTYFGRNGAFAQRLLKEVRQCYRDLFIREVGLFVPSENQWNFHSGIGRRSKQNIVLAGDRLGSLLADLDSFFASEERYIELGIPYKRNYLFTGPPGTGKTSLIKFLSSHYQRNVYFFTSTLGSESLFASTLSLVPSNSFVVLEDIDCLFQSLTGDNVDTKTGRLLGGQGTGRRVGMSSLLNCLDGMTGKHGVVVFVTTNHPERLDPALIRAGRMDYRLELGLCTADQLKRMFLRFFPEQELLAEAFSTLLPAHKLSPAQIQEHLTQCLNNPQQAVDRIDELKERVLAIRRTTTV